jgi:excisionase family DNA binding protein
MKSIEQPPELAQLLTVKQAARFLGRSVRTIYRMIRMGDLKPSRRFLRHSLFTKADLWATVKAVPHVDVLAAAEAIKAEQEVRKRSREARKRNAV